MSAGRLDSHQALGLESRAGGHPKYSNTRQDRLEYKNVTFGKMKGYLLAISLAPINLWNLWVDRIPQSVACCA